MGPNITPVEIALFFESFDVMKAGDIAILSGSIPPSLGSDFYNRIIAKCESLGVEFIIDTTGASLLDTLARKPF
ncbi:Tagatose-6-phosphate kinase [Listeria booriae]|nr:Tagatose-6-phosphate kinase [Listeria booriae]